ncbi:MAG TPA: filamentous hemagglutinin N-terminal domain-containing protein [Verrucomicrobiae bacterium]|nr:filamentous hemagglutinin N-terminal domain-containing protein [Verrucomicrobiae bacterium]
MKSGWLLAALCAFIPGLAEANPHGGSVAQGSATFNNSGSQLTITTSAQAYINWQSFNIGLGESTTFIQPSSSSLVWNHINDASPSQILGSLSANGYVVLQNQNGFYVGGQASITAHGLIMTTAAIPMPDLSSGGAWNFSAPPPTATIVNYGQINVGQGGAYLIAHDIENHGQISASQGDLGLYAGQTVLLSQRPDGRGLSASVTLPEGSVDNSGKLIADAGSIALRAQVVNQGGLIQANSVRNVNGHIELIASDSLNLSASSVISSKGDVQGVSSGGSVVLKSGNAFSDASGSVIDVSGGTQGGAGGAVEISSASVAPFLSQINARANSGFAGGALTLDPLEIILNTAMINSLNAQIAGGVSQINLQADDNITMSAGATWALADLPATGSLTLSAGNNITLNNGSFISAGKNWNVNLFAGTAFSASDSQPKPVTGSDGVFLNGSSYIESQNGNINISAANDVLVNSSLSTSGGLAGIRTRAGGSIDVTAQYGNVTTGGNSSGFSFSGLKGVTISTTLGGISTAAGGDVNITAGGDITSFPATANVTTDAGSGAFGSNPGNVTINAGGNVYGDFVVTHGKGTITAGGNIGDTTRNVALSLVNGGWTLNAPNGNIYLQEARNPNGIYNDSKTPNPGAFHFFDYDPQSYVSLNAGIGVDLTGSSLPRGSMNVQLGAILPPILSISAGSGGVTIEKSFILFPSAYQNLDIKTTGGGDFVSIQGSSSSPNQFIMSDSAQHQALNTDTFGPDDHGGVSLGVNNPDPATIDISGSMENISLFTSKQTDIKVGGDMINCSFSGQNLHSSDVTSIDVAGQIFNRSVYTFDFLDASIQNIPFADLPPGVSPTWETVFSYAVDAGKIASLKVPTGLTPDQYLGFLSQQGVYVFNSNPGFVYNTTTRRLGFVGTMSAADFANLLKPITVVQFDPITGKPAVDASGHFKTDTLKPFASSDSLTQLYYASHDPLYGANVDPGVDPNNLPTVGAPGLGDPASHGLKIDGPGQFNIHAGSIDLGNTEGILSEGIGRSYNLIPLTPAGADIHITTDGNLEMLSSAIGSLYGGSISLNIGGSIDLGASELATATKQNIGTLGVFTTDGGNISVVANGNVNVDGSRIAAFNGGDIYVKSLTGNVDVGDGKSGALNFVTIYYVLDGIGHQSQQYIYGSGILASTLYDNLLPGSALIPGNITVETPRGDILSSLGGILQIALNHNFAPGPTITLTAGTPASGDFPGYVGNIDLGASGVIGGTIKLTANGDITGLIISRQDSTINAAQSFSGTVLSGGTANLSAGGSIAGTVVGVGGVNASGGSIQATLLGQNVSANGAAAQSTLGTTAAASSTAQAAANQSSTDTKEQVASNNTDDDEKKKKGKQPRLTRRVGRVTVILPQES